MPAHNLQQPAVIIDLSRIRLTADAVSVVKILADQCPTVTTEPKTAGGIQNWIEYLRSLSPQVRIYPRAAEPNSPPGSRWYKAALNRPMAELIVTCPECGLRDELAHGDLKVDDPQGQCSHRLHPAKCPAFRVPLIAARRMLDFLEWDRISDSDEEIRILPSLIEAPMVPDMPSTSRPSAGSVADGARTDVEPVGAAEGHGAHVT
jgi:hypothetical protein